MIFYARQRKPGGDWFTVLFHEEVPQKGKIAQAQVVWIDQESIKQVPEHLENLSFQEICAIMKSTK